MNVNFMYMAIEIGGESSRGSDDREVSHRGGNGRWWSYRGSEDWRVSRRGSDGRGVSLRGSNARRWSRRGRYDR